MKKTLLLVAFFAMHLSFAQPYLPMLQEDHQWSTDVYVNPFDPDCEICNCCSYTVTKQVTLGEDVIVDGKTYKRVQSDENGTTCLVREENGIVFKYSEITGNEVVMYNFNLELGDTFMLAESPDSYYCGWEGWNNFTFEIEVIDVSIQSIAGENRKVIQFDHFNELGIFETWIEGIGSLVGFDPIGEEIDWTFGTALVCFNDNNGTYFFNNANSCDNTTLNVSENLQQQILLAPNPVKDTSILQLPPELGIDRLRIYSITGQLVHEETVTSDYATINAMHYRSGLYFYQVLSEKTVVKTERFITK